MVTDLIGIKPLGVFDPQPTTTAVTNPGSNSFGQIEDILKQKALAGWSPSKIESLRIFLGSKAATTIQSSQQPHGGRAMVPLGPQEDNQTQRPQVGLRYLLRNGPSDSGMPKTWQQDQAPLTLGAAVSHRQSLAPPHRLPKSRSSVSAL